MTRAVLGQRTDRVLLITIKHPKARNSITRDVGFASRDAVDELDESPGPSAGILAGTGGTSCAGTNLKACDSAAR